LYSRCLLFLGIAVTPVHVGVGRSPGIVDLPIARDGFGIPYIPASSLKGSTKSLCLNLMDRRCCERVYGWDIRFEEVPVEPYVSAAAFTDALLLLYPVRVETGEGVRFAYATSVLQLRRLLDIVRVCDASHGNVSCLNGLDALILLAENRGCQGVGDVYMNNVKASYCNYISLPRGNSAIEPLLEQVGEAGVALVEHLAEGGVYILRDDEVFREVVEAGLIRQTRISLDPATKTVKTGALWSEEYVSQGAVFAFATLFRSNNIIEADDAERLHVKLLKQANNYLVIGGKETIGRGIIRLHQACTQ
jgi:CRISPR-associated protein Cmr4